MSDYIGTLFVDEKPLPITRIYLERGEFQIETVIHGPINLPDETEVMVHDPAGRLVVIAPWRVAKADRKKLRSSYPHRVTTIALPLRVIDSDWP